MHTMLMSQLKQLLHLLHDAVATASWITGHKLHESLLTGQ